MANTPYTVSVAHASTLAQWFRESGGVTLWHSLNLSDPGKTWYTRLGGAKPHWSAGSPEDITDPAQIGVVTYREVRRFRVAVRPGAQGFSIKLTDASSARLLKALDKAGDEACYEFDYLTQEAVILVPGETVALDIQ